MKFYLCREIFELFRCHFLASRYSIWVIKQIMEAWSTSLDWHVLVTIKVEYFPLILDHSVINNQLIFYFFVIKIKSKHFLYSFENSFFSLLPQNPKLFPSRVREQFWHLKYFVCLKEVLTFFWKDYIVNAGIRNDIRI